MKSSTDNLETQIRDLIIRHNKMLSFIKSLANDDYDETYEDLDEVMWVANDVLDDMEFLKDE